MLRFCLIVIFLPFVSYASCIQPLDINMRTESTVMPAQQKWIYSGITVLNTDYITGLDVLHDKVNFCAGLNKDFNIVPGEKEYTLPFSLYAGDKVNFSIMGSKVCINRDGTKRYITINQQCNEMEEEHFARILNKRNCEYGVCPNRYIPQDSNVKWLNGRESWSGKASEVVDIAKDFVQIMERIKKDPSCDALPESEIKKVDTYILNSICGNICNKENCVTTESLHEDVNAHIQSMVNEKRSEEIMKLIFEDLFDDTHVKKEIGSYIPYLFMEMKNENFHNEPIHTHYDYSISRPHNKDENLTFRLGDDESREGGGYNIMMSVTRQVDLKKTLYVHVSTDDNMPEHTPGSDSDNDISIDISNTADVTEVLKRLNEKIGILGTSKAKIYYGITDHGCGYTQNTGAFDMNLTMRKSSKKIVSTIYQFFRDKITGTFSITERVGGEINKTSHAMTIYNRLISRSSKNNIRSIIVASLTLFIVLYTLCYFFGLSNISVYEFLMICVRIGIVTQLLRADSWSFFSHYVFAFFEKIPEELMHTVHLSDTTSGPAESVFRKFDEPFDRFLSWKTWQLILTLVFSGPLGIVAFCLIIYGTVKIIKSLFNALFSFATYSVIIALLVSLAPIFITFLLFKYTRRMFMLWIGGLATFGIQPVILTIAMSLVIQAMNYVIYSMFNFQACTGCILDINIDLPIINVNPCLLYGYVTDVKQLNLGAVMAFIILAEALDAMVDLSSTISQTLFGRTSIPVQAGAVGEQFKQTLLGVVGLDDQNRMMQSIQRPVQRPVSSNQVQGRQR